MKFRVDKISGLIQNDGDVAGSTMRSINEGAAIVVAQGFGVPRHGHNFPLRFGAYIIPALRLIAQLPGSATAELYFATQGVIRANGASNGNRFEETAIRMSRVIREYIALVHPVLDSRVRILHDRAIRPHSPTEQLIEKLLQIGEKVASSRVRAFAEKRGGRQALRYMVEHLLYMRDLPTTSDVGLLVPDMTSEYDHLIMIGGPSEKIFFEFRQSICKELKETSEKNHQFFTPVGDPPTYHMQDGELTWEDRQQPELNDVRRLIEKTLEQVKPGMGVRQAVLRDLLILLNDAGGNDDFRWCGRTATDIEKGRDPGELPLEIIQRGWNVLRSLPGCD